VRAGLLLLLASCTASQHTQPALPPSTPSGFQVIGYVRSLRVGLAQRPRQLDAVYLVGYTQAEFDAHAAGSPLFRRVVTPYDFEGMSRESEVLIRIRAGERCTPNLTRTVCLYMLEFGWTWLEEGT